MTDISDPADTTRARITRAEIYFNDHLRDQRGWYDRKASRYKRWHKWLGLVIIAAGAATAVVQLWTPSPPDTPVHWSAAITAILGAMVVLAKGIERLWSFDENWSGYRQASEAMKREQRLFINDAGSYAGLNDEPAYRLFVERVEEIIAAEQHGFWQNNRQGGGVVGSSGGETDEG